MHMYSLTDGQSIMFLYDGTWCQLHHEESCIQCKELCELSLWYLSGHIQCLRHTVSIGNSFLWRYVVFSFSDSSVSSQNLVFSGDRYQEGEGCRFLKKRVRSRRGRGLGKESGGWYTFPHYDPSVHLSVAYHN